MMLLILMMEFVFIIFLIKRAFMFYKKAYQQEIISVQRYKQLQFFKTIVCKKNCNFNEYLKNNNIQKVAIYGIGMVYKAVEEDLLNSVEIEYYVDKYSTLCELNGIQVIHKIPDMLKMKEVDAIIVTAIGFFNEIEKEMQEYNIKIRMIDIEKIIYYNKEIVIENKL